MNRSVLIQAPTAPAMPHPLMGSPVPVPMPYPAANRKIRQGLAFEFNFTGYEGGSTVFNKISTGQNATLVGTDFLTTFGGVMRFDGTNNDYVTIPSPSPLAGTALFTFTIWVNTASITGLFGGTNRAAFLFGGGTGTGAGQSELFILSASNTSFTPDQLIFGRGGGSTVGSCAIPVRQIMRNNTWHHIAIARSAVASQSVYVDGRLAGVGNVSNSFSTGITAFGALPGNAAYGGRLNGLVGEICIYNQALSAADILQNYTATRGRFDV
jgi:hypothetical protein